MKKTCCYCNKRIWRWQGHTRALEGFVHLDWCKYRKEMDQIFSEMKLVSDLMFLGHFKKKKT